VGQWGEMRRLSDLMMRQCRTVAAAGVQLDTLPCNLAASMLALVSHDQALTPITGPFTFQVTNSTWFVVNQVGLCMHCQTVVALVLSCYSHKWDQQNFGHVMHGRVRTVCTLGNFLTNTSIAVFVR
jgi:hypothetical protein